MEKKNLFFRNTHSRCIVQVMYNIIKYWHGLWDQTCAKLITQIDSFPWQLQNLTNQKIALMFNYNDSGYKYEQYNTHI